MLILLRAGHLAGVQVVIVVPAGIGTMSLDAHDPRFCHRG